MRSAVPCRIRVGTSIRLMSWLKSSSQPTGAGPGRLRRGLGTGVPQRADGVLADPLAQVVIQVEEVADQPAQPRGTVVEDGLLDAGDTGGVDPPGVVVRLRERRREALDEDAAGEPF